MDRVVGLGSGFFALCRGLERVASRPHAAPLLPPLLLSGRLRTPIAGGLLILLPQRPAHQPVVQAGELVIPLGHAELLQIRAHLVRVRVRVRISAGVRARV